jgi:signal-transduction protein with cAMP-binding, CBS, and nucleotidyltransferase domain
MTLKELLITKPSKLVTCKTSCIAADAISIMDGKGIGSILVYDDNDRLAGIFTERDIMRCFAKNIPLNEITMSRVMTPNPMTLDASSDVGVAMALMSEKKIRHMPVTEEGKVIGVISYRDLVSFILPDVIYMAEDTM